MPTHKSFMLALMSSLVIGALPSVSAQSAPALTLDQAVLQVQRDTGGKVLSAEPRRFGRRLEYRIKVLTPEGHVRVVAVSSESSKDPASTQSFKNSPATGAGSKERH